MSKCYLCKAETLWIKLLSGRKVECDPWAVPYIETENGSLTLVTEDGYIRKCRPDTSNKSKRVGYTLHKKTCRKRQNDQ